MLKAQRLRAGDASKSNLVPTDDNGLVYARTVPNVLRIVYLGNALKGGFFPEGTFGRVALSLMAIQILFFCMHALMWAEPNMP